MQRTRTGESTDLSPAWDSVACPECGGPAEVQWRSVLESTDGPVEHAKVLCAQRHWFLLPVERLASTHDAGQ
jgi:hypothetical protein